MTLTATSDKRATDGSSPRYGRLVRLRTRPGRIRALAAAATLAVLGLLVVTFVVVGDARDGLRVIGHDAGPQVVATGDLYFALSDMDAQLAAALLIGGDQNLATGRAQALRMYDQRRSEADRALLQAAELAAGDPTEQVTARSMMDALGRYDRLAGQAVQTDQQSHHPAGPPPQGVLGIYQQATDLMKLQILPQAYNLTLDNGTKVRRTYEAKRSAVLSGRLWVGIAGLVLLVVLAGIQLYLTARFRRLVNPSLAVATAGVLVLVAVSLVMLSSEAGKLRTAKEDGFDSVLTLSRARAISNSASADESRYLLDPGRADTYEQVYLDKSQQVLYVPAGNLDTYYSRVGGRDFLGFLGTEAHHVTLPGQRAALDTVLRRYRQIQRDDQQIRRLVTGGNRVAAVVLRENAVARDISAYDRSLVALRSLHRRAFDTAIHDGDGALNGWNGLLPGSAVALVLLVVAGVRPRLLEYR